MTNLVAMDVQASTASLAPIRFAWLEITPNCQLTCEHCYVASHPGLGHGKLTVVDWQHVMNSLRSLGVQEVQFIGGEATTHPSFCELVEYAAIQGFTIEVFSNLVGITQRMWDIFTRLNVRIATSFYSTEASIHDAITTLPGSHQKTLENMKKALALGLTLRVGIIDVRDDQDIPGTKAFLKELGVAQDRIGSDRVRGVGRGFNLSKEDNISALCGKCTSGSCAVTAEGAVYPCIMARSFSLGSVLKQDITDILAGETFVTTTYMLNSAFAARDTSGSNASSSCNPQCSPNCRPKDCAPCSPRGGL